MKKKIYLILPLVFILLNGCSGYKPIFASGDINLKIINHIEEGEKKLSKKIFNNLDNLIKSQNSKNPKEIEIYIEISKTKDPTVRDSSGKIKEYRITLNTLIKIKDYLKNIQIMNENFTNSSVYKVLDNYSETIDAENKTIENLVNNTYQELLISLSKIK